MSRPLARRRGRPSASGWRLQPQPPPLPGLRPLTRLRHWSRRGHGRPLRGWPGPRSHRRRTAGPTSLRAQGRRGHPLLLSRPPGGRQRWVTFYRTGQLSARPPPSPLRGSCLEDRPTRCTTSGPRRGGRPMSRWLRAARWGERWQEAGPRPTARPSVRAPTRMSGRPRVVPQGPPDLHRGGTGRRRRGAGDSRNAAGLSPLGVRARVRGPGTPRPARARRGPRLTT